MNKLSVLAFLGMVAVANACDTQPVATLQSPSMPRYTLTGGIYGPSTVKPNSTCLWETAGGSGGTAPYDYSWLSSQGAYGYGMTFHATAPSSGPMIITLTITDAALNEVTVRKTVGVSPSAPVCAN